MIGSYYVSMQGKLIPNDIPDTFFSKKFKKVVITEVLVFTIYEKVWVFCFYHT